MKPIRLLAFAAASLAALASAPMSETIPAAPAAAGPGGVIHAIEGFLAALDRGDRDAIAKWLEDGVNDYTVAYDAGGKAQHDAKQRPTVANFIDAGLAKGCVTETMAPFVEAALAGANSAKDAKNGDDAKISAPRITHRLTAIRADCPSERCSYGIAEFERRIERDSGVTVVPMRATVLVQYDREANGFRIFHWHASAR
jgi:hypothetical protein